MVLVQLDKSLESQFPKELKWIRQFYFQQLDNMEDK